MKIGKFVNNKIKQKWQKNKQAKAKTRCKKHWTN